MIYVMSRGRLNANFIPPKDGRPHSIISIRGRLSDYVDDPSANGIIKECFEDWKRRARGLTITPEHAQRIARFGLEAISRGDDLYIHCAKGKSRSVACGIALGLATKTPVQFFEYKNIVVPSDKLADYESYGLDPNRIVLEELQKAIAQTPYIG